MTGASPFAQAGQPSVAPERWRRRPTPAPEQTAGDRAPASFWLLLAFLLLLYANTPKVLPALDAIHPAAVVGGCALLALACEVVFGGRKLAYGGAEGGLL